MRIRILHCLETIGSGGVEQLRLLLARHLDPDRFEMQIVCTQSRGGLPAEFAAAGIPLHEIGVFRHIAERERYRRALGVVRTFRPHIIHGAVFEGVATAMVAGRLGGVPIRIAEETSDPQNRSWRGNLLIRLLYSQAQAVIGVSPAVVSYLRGIGVPAGAATLIANGVAAPRPVSPQEIADLRARLGIAPGDFVIGSLGRLFDSHKKVSNLIDAAATLAPTLPRLKLLIVGDGRDRAALQERASDRGIADRCIFAGYQKDTAPYYALMDVFVLASAFEAFGLVLAEAMLAGKPVIGTRVGGVPHVLGGGAAGILVEPGSPAAIAEAVSRLAADPQERARLAADGLAYARSHHGAARYVDEIAQLYERLARAAAP